MKRKNIQMIEELHPFCIRLKQVREMRKMSQSELAKLSRLPPASISNFESGKRLPSLQSILALQRVLRVTADFLLGLDISMSHCDQAFKVRLAMLSDSNHKVVSSLVDVLLAQQKLCEGEK